MAVAGLFCSRKEASLVVGVERDSALQSLRCGASTGRFVAAGAASLGGRKMGKTLDGSGINRGYRRLDMDK